MHRHGIICTLALVCAAAQPAWGQAVETPLLRHDANHDGVLTVADDVLIATDAYADVPLWANLDDDDRDGKIDARNAVIEGNRDLADLIPVEVHLPSVVGWDSLRVWISPATARDRVRIFEGQPRGPARALNAAVDHLDPTRLESTQIIPLWIEAKETRGPAWDGRFALHLQAASEGRVLSTQALRFRVAPVLFPDNTQRATDLYVMRITNYSSAPNTPFYATLAEQLPEHISLQGLNEYTYFADRWVQDTMQIGYQAQPGTEGARYLPTFLQTKRPTGWYGLERLVPIDLFGPDVAFVAPAGDYGSSHNYGGNLEVAPPHTSPTGDFPFGRIVVGAGNEGTLLGYAHADGMDAAQYNWLTAQESQGPPLIFSTEWLAVGHLDEVFLFVPDRRADAARPWKVVFASPRLALAGLEDLSQRQRGNAIVFADREEETSVTAILQDADLMAYNQAAQARIDSIRFKLEEALGLSDTDVIEVPVLFEGRFYNGIDQAVAYNPGIQNLMVADEKLFVPDPEGPIDGDEDVWRTETRRRLAPLGMEVVFVDVFNSYHRLMGEAHCGTNFQRQPFAQNVWEVE